MRRCDGAKCVTARSRFGLRTLLVSFSRRGRRRHGHRARAGSGQSRLCVPAREINQPWDIRVKSPRDLVWFGKIERNVQFFLDFGCYVGVVEKQSDRMWQPAVLGADVFRSGPRRCVQASSAAGHRWGITYFPLLRGRGVDRRPLVRPECVQEAARHSAQPAGPPRSVARRRPR